MTLYDHHLNIYLDIKHQIVKFAGNHCRFHLGVSIATSLHIKKANGVYIQYIYIIYINDWQRHLLLDVLQLDVWIPFIEKNPRRTAWNICEMTRFCRKSMTRDLVFSFLAVWIIGLGHAGHTRVVRWLKRGGKTYKPTQMSNDRCFSKCFKMFQVGKGMGITAYSSWSYGCWVVSIICARYVRSLMKMMSSKVLKDLPIYIALRCEAENDGSGRFKRPRWP